MDRIIMILIICLLMGGCSQATTEETQPVLPASAAETTSGTCPKEAKTLVSWNAMNFGSKKSDRTIALMAEILLSRGVAYQSHEKIRADIILLQEVNAGAKTKGIQAVKRLEESLGQDWDSITSDATTGGGVERYAILWRKGEITLNRREAQLVNDLADSIDREPFGTSISIGARHFWVYSFHAVPTAKNPIREIKLVASSGELLARETAVLAGDFNLGRQTVESSFGGWEDHIDKKTSLRSTLSSSGEYRSYQYDHILTKGKIKVCESGVLDFVSVHFSPITPDTLLEARKVSDHLPVYIRFTLE